MHRLLTGLILLVMAGFGQTAPAARPSAGKKTAAAPARQSSAASDAALEKEIRARFARSKISADKFEAHVQGGVATITGKTNVLQHKGTATRLAKNAGAAKVVNNVEISDEAREKAASNLATGARRAQVKRSEVPNRN